MKFLSVGSFLLRGDVRIHGKTEGTTPSLTSFFPTFGFPNWETFTAVYKYLDPGEKGENISYWRSTNPGIFSDYTKEDNADESLTKKGRASKARINF